jgi:opacity protein-like surface antigen
MKKLFIAAIAVLAFGSANAQETKFGVKAGLNFSNFTGDVENNSMKVGFHVGGLVNIKVSDKFAVQPELLYSGQGAKFDGGVTVSADYLNIPVMAQFKIADKFSLEAGPQIGFLMSAKAKGSGQTVDVKEFYNSTDFGINIGAGYDVTENINVGLRYTIGVSNIAKDSGDYKEGNSNIAFALGYKF